MEVDGFSRFEELSIHAPDFEISIRLFFYFLKLPSMDHVGPGGPDGAFGSLW